MDRIYVSHPNLDHFSAIPTLVKELNCGPILVNEHFKSRSPARSPSRHLLSLLRKTSHPVEVQRAAQAEWTIGDVTFERLWPPAQLSDSYTVNDTSTVLRLSYAGASILLTGDIEEAAQRELTQTVDLDADVLLLPHHGSVADSLSEFLHSVGAAVLIRSGSARKEDTMNGLYDLVDNAMLYSTADHGAVTVELTRTGIEVSFQLDEFTREIRDR